MGEYKCLSTNFWDNSIVYLKICQMPSGELYSTNEAMIGEKSQYGNESETFGEVAVNVMRGQSPLIFEGLITLLAMILGG